VLALNPADLFRVGPQLSFLAVAILIWLSGLASERRPQRDRLEQMLAATRPRFVRIAAGVWRWNRWLLTATLAVWMTALPLVLFHFHVVTPVALLIAPAVWVFVLAALWSGYAMLLVGWLLPPLGAALGALCNSSLAGLEAVVHWAESLPAGHFWAPGPAWWWVTVFYAGVVAAILWGRRIAPARWQVAALSAWIVIGIIPPLYRSLGRDSLECSFIAIGHGTCVLLEAPNGDTLLYDAGAIASPEFATRTISAYLWHRGIMRIDGIVLSHADIDHFNAVPGLLERFHIGAVYVSPMMFDGFDAKPQANLAPWRPDPAFAPDVLREALERAGVPIHVVWAGDRLRLGTDVTIDVLHPPRVGVLGSDNANSITLAVEAAGRRVLLTGDLESPGLEDVIAERPLDCDVLLAPHHGSRRSDPPGFAAWSTPEWVVISGGEADVAPVVQTYEAAGAIVAQTRQLGTVTFSIGRDELAAAAWRDGDRRLSGDRR
jgi:competence protein ComEC